MIQSCQICGNEDNNSFHVAKEMHLGLRDEFNYLECVNCGCLQLINIPADFSKYYPQDYYSFKSPMQKTSWKKYRLSKRTAYWLNHPTFIGWLLCLGKKRPDRLIWSKKIHLRFSSRILDIGCGSGTLLSEMAEAGFTNLIGVDPYIQHDIAYKNSVKIFKSEIYDLNNKQFDFIMLHHSFEHMQNPEQVLNKIYTLLAPKAHLLIRIPIASSYAWRHYGINWVQLDAPRHLFLHTVKSIELLAHKSNLVIKDIIWDSTASQFLGSESYKKGLSLVDSKMPDLTKEDLKSYRDMAAKLNLKHDGDQACFLFTKS
ncbi:class I SAM-dependent methyltransferase [Sporomusa sp. KB1]|uniref:class I SAM-dependent methyltransferase n=1 Tax=Sporomusa sp. KB1 TaxID=943346 RepID=UPI0011AC41AA|nr:class I SAM-dependent methyltransferase [Sporomusa sp. KB1]TWH47805.1 methyltransferase family protein [Sporomusa sp. KB1]